MLERPQTSRHARGIADERNEPRYNPRILRAERVTDGPAGAGTRFQAELKAMGRTMPMTVEVTEFDRPRRLCVKDHLVDMETDGALTFAPVAGGTRMRWSWDVRPHGVLKLMTPLLGVLERRQEQAIWGEPKRSLEAQTGRS